jgi:hypothetical protein
MRPWPDVLLEARLRMASAGAPLRRLVIGARSRPVRFAGWAVAAILAVAAATAYGVALWRAPVWMHATTPQDRYNARVLVISVGGALVVGTGLLYTARNYRLSRRGQVTDRFTIALERLGSTELYVRIGGVHALEHVMRDSPDHHDDVMEVLTEFIRGGVPHVARQSDHQAWMHPVTGSVPDPPPEEPTPDVQAALTALAHRPLRPERGGINLSGLHLTNAVLNGVDLTGATLNDANLTGARLNGANLTGAILWDANLTGAALHDANLTVARLHDANLTDAGLNGANLTDAGLHGANLTGARLDGANLTVADLWDANLIGARLDGANLTGARLYRAKWTDADLDGAKLTGAFLGPDPSVVPPGWIVTNRDTGRLGRPTPQQLPGH